MNRIAAFDPNMKIAGNLTGEPIAWYDAKEAPFSIHGLWDPKGDHPYMRMPAETASAVSPGVEFLARNTAGGRVRFVTDSPFAAIHAELPFLCPMDHMPDTGIFGFDMYSGDEPGTEVYRGTYRPPDMEKCYESRLNIPGEGLRTITIHFPLYNPVDRLAIGVAEGARILPAPEYPDPLPIVFYGSSITQGGCASRPGNAYSNMIGRILGVETLNLGFSGSAKGEDTMVKYLANLPMRAFVCDYDHNAPTAEHLAATHAPLVRAVREANPDLPILLVSAPPTSGWDNLEERRDIIIKTYEEMLRKGDRHIAFLDGSTMYEGPLSGDCTVDGCHPNDLGMMRMALKISEALKMIL